MNYNALPWQNDSTDSFGEIETSLENDQKRLNLPDRSKTFNYLILIPKIRLPKNGKL